MGQSRRKQLSAVKEFSSSRQVAIETAGGQELATNYHRLHPLSSTTMSTTMCTTIHVHHHEDGRSIMVKKSEQQLFLVLPGVLSQIWKNIVNACLGSIQYYTSEGPPKSTTISHERRVLIVIMMIWMKPDQTC